MATLPNIALFAPGEKPASAKMNSLRDGINFFLNRPTALVFNGAIAAATGGSGTYMTFASERYDNDGIHSTTTNTSRLTCVTPGVYTISGHLYYAGNATGTKRNLAIRLNGVTILPEVTVVPDAGNPTGVALTVDWKLVAGDYLELRAFHDAGVAVNVTPQFGMTWISAG